LALRRCHLRRNLEDVKLAREREGAVRDRLVSEVDAVDLEALVLGIDEALRPKSAEASRLRDRLRSQHRIGVTGGGERLAVILRAELLHVGAESGAAGEILEALGGAGEIVAAIEVNGAARRRTAVDLVPGVDTVRPAALAGVGAGLAKAVAA